MAGEIMHIFIERVVINYLLGASVLIKRIIYIGSFHVYAS